MCNELEQSFPVFRIKLSFFRKLPPRLNVEKSFKFKHFTHKKMPFFLVQSYFKKPYHSFAEEITFFPLVIKESLCDNAYSCVNLKIMPFKTTVNWLFSDM